MKDNTQYTKHNNREYTQTLRTCITINTNITKIVNQKQQT